MEEESNDLLLRAVNIMNKIIIEQRIDITSSKDQLEAIKNRVQAVYNEQISTDKLSGGSKSDEDSVSEQISNFLAHSTQKQKQCSYFPLHWSLQNKGDQFFIYGGFCLDFTYKIQDDSAQKRLRTKVNHIEYFKQQGLLLIQYDQQSPTVKDFSQLIERAQSMADYQYYILSLCLIEYQKCIQPFIDMGRQRSIEYQKNNLIDSYEQSYQRFEKWAINEVLKIDSNRLYGFSIMKFNMNTLEFETKKVGYSSGLLALRGIDLNYPFQYMRKETYHYLDGESNLNLLINQLSRVAQGKEIIPFKTHMMTFDRLRIEVDLKCKQFTNRDEQYPYKSDLQFHLDFQYEFMITVGFYDVSAETLKNIMLTRESRDDIANQALDDFTYSIESQIFLEQFYKEKTKQKKQQPSYSEY